MRPINGISTSRWLYHLTTFDKFRTEATENMTGTAGQRRIPTAYLEKHAVLLPPLDLQNRFAAFAEAADKSKFELIRTLDELDAAYKALVRERLG
jgi:type I restriction enzyme S subunit